MTSTTSEEGGGSFRALRGRHLTMFDKRLHRHDRGWPNASTKTAEKPAAEPVHKVKRVWKNAGIFHFPHHDEEDAD